MYSRIHRARLCRECKSCAIVRERVLGALACSLLSVATYVFHKENEPWLTS
jgi:hypothetical protein